MVPSTHTRSRSLDQLMARFFDYSSYAIPNAFKAGRKKNEEMGKKSQVFFCNVAAINIAPSCSISLPDDDDDNDDGGGGGDGDGENIYAHTTRVEVELALITIARAGKLVQSTSSTKFLLLSARRGTVCAAYCTCIIFTRRTFVYRATFLIQIP